MRDEEMNSVDTTAATDAASISDTANTTNTTNTTDTASNAAIFTGERFVPGIQNPELETEHYQRYYSVLPLVKDKYVLDVACGEGYGSFILSTAARNVLGIDIAGDVIERIQRKYASVPNLSFSQGDVAALPLADNCVDVIVSFETIEHISETQQCAFLKQAVRVLKKDGILIISTPNKEIYSDRAHYHNEFHIKEFYRQEFLDFLNTGFKNVLLYNQYFEVVSIIDLPGKQSKTVSYYKGEDYFEDGKYYIAIAGNTPLPQLDISAITMNSFPEYWQKISRILQLQQEEEERNLHISRLDQEIASLRNQLQSQEEALHEKENILSNIVIHLQEKDAPLADLKNRLQKKDSALTDLECRLQEKDSALTDLESHLQEKESTLADLTNRLQARDAALADLEQTIRNKEGHIQQLLEVEREYEREKKSRTYRVALIFRRISTFFLPANSRRRFLFKIFLKTLRHPVTMLHTINMRRIRNFFEISKNEGMGSVNLHYRLVEEYEQSMQNTLHPEQLDVTATSSDTFQTLDDYKQTLDFSYQEDPLVSIIIPVYNQFDYTYNCLASLLRNSGDVSYEVLLADDCSTDLTTRITEKVHGITVIRNEQNLRFLKNCNHATQFARGKYILFLNNDTQVQNNWLAPLVKLLEEDSSIGMTGSKLVYADGRLQEAGGILWKDGSAWNYGNGKNPDDPEFNYVKDVDYISGASLMIRTSLWKKIGGFDEQFAPAYYEDTDLAFEVRKHGYRVVYQPLSVVVHFEGISNGTDITEGQKSYQQKNAITFYEKWKNVLEKEHFPNAENVFIAKDRSARKKHILVVDHYVPHPDKDAGGKCTYMYLLMFVRMGLQVTFIGDNFYKHEPYTTDLNQHGVEVLYGNYYFNNWQQWLKDNLHYFDYVYLQRPHISIKYIDLVKEYGHAKVFYFAHDLHHLREYREYLLTGDEDKLRSSEHWKTIEYELFEKADVGHVVGSYEQAVMQEAFPNKPIRNIPLYIYENILTDFEKDFSLRKDLLYVGGFGHPPNIDAVLWFGTTIFPKILNVHSNIRWHVVGGNVPLEVQKLASDNIIIEGFLSDEDLSHLYRSCRLAVVPLRVGAGVKGKVVEAAYFQIPLVTTKIGAEGLDSTMGNMLVEDDPDKIVSLICDLYNDTEKLREMSDAGASFIQKYFTLEEAERVLKLDMDI